MPASPANQPKASWKARFDALIQPYIPEYFPVAWKMGLSISALILIGMTLLAFILLNNQLQRMRDQADSFGNAIATQLAHTAREPLLAEDRFLLKVHINNLVRSDSIAGAALFNREGQPIDQAGVQPPASAPSSTEVRRWGGLGENAMSTYFAPVRVNDNLAGSVAVTLSDRSITLAQREVRNTLITATLAMGVLAIIASFLISRRLAQPIHNLLAATSAMRKGDLQYRIQERRNDEIGHLIEAYNGMAHGMLEKDQVERVLQRFVSPSVARKMMANLDQVTLGGRDVTATVVFADIVGFTRLSESLAPEAVADILPGHHRQVHGRLRDDRIRCARGGFRAPFPRSVLRGDDSAAGDPSQRIPRRARPDHRGIPHRYEFRGHAGRQSRFQGAHAIHGGGRHGESGLAAVPGGRRARPVGNADGTTHCPIPCRNQRGGRP